MEYLRLNAIMVAISCYFGRETCKVFKTQGNDSLYFEISASLFWEPLYNKCRTSKLQE